MITVFDGLILGLIQGIAEWLPVSSEAIVSIVAINVLDIDPAIVIDLALSLHLGSVVAALIYFRSDITSIIKPSDKDYRLLIRLIVITLVSLGLGGVLYLLLKTITLTETGGSILTLIMGCALLVTAGLLRAKPGLGRDIGEMTWRQTIVIGLTQGLAIIPGISRSGSTTAVALWQDFTTEQALRLSFLIGIPMILAGSGLLLITQPDVLSLVWSAPGLAALLTAGIVGWLTIDWLLLLARKVSFSTFVGGLGIVTIVFVATALV